MSQNTSDPLTAARRKALLEAVSNNGWLELNAAGYQRLKVTFGLTRACVDSLVRELVREGELWLETDGAVCLNLSPSPAERDRLGEPDAAMPAGGSAP